jgi:hypothetical protein
MLSGVTGELRGERTRNRQCAGGAQAPNLHPSRRSLTRRHRPTVGLRSSKPRMRVQVPLPALSCGALRAPSPLRGEHPPLTRLRRCLVLRTSAARPRRFETSKLRDNLSQFSDEECGLQHRRRGFDSLSALQTDHDGLVTLDSLIRSPHRVRFTGDPRRQCGARRLVTAPV